MSPQDRESLRDQAASIAIELKKTAEKLKASADAFDRAAASPEAGVEHDLERLHAILGGAFRVLPRFKAANASELQAAFANSAALQAGDPLNVLTWHKRAARVREGAARLDSVLTYDDALHPGADLPLKVGQLPHEEGARWAGLAPESGKQVPGGTTSLVAHFPAAGFEAFRSLAGLLVDDWQEVVPSATETTGVAFHYDRPNTFPPQAILLAVPPDEREAWDLDLLEKITLETLELLKLRAVDPDALNQVEEIGHFLPALFVSLNLGGDTVSTDFRRAAKQEVET